MNLYIMSLRFDWVDSALTVNIFPALQPWGDLGEYKRRARRTETETQRCWRSHQRPWVSPGPHGGFEEGHRVQVEQCPLQSPSDHRLQPAGPAYRQSHPGQKHESTSQSTQLSHQRLVHCMGLIPKCLFCVVA